MTPVVGRREQRFAELVEERAGRHRRTDLDPELAPLVRLATGLGTCRLASPPREEYRLDLRAMLLATTDREGIGATAVIPAQRTGNASASPPSNLAARRHRTRIALLIGVTGALALSGVSQASVNALPGDPLYSVKRSTEQAQLALAGSDLARGTLLLEHAKIRLQEALRVVNRDLQADALTVMNAETTEAFRLLATFAVDHHDQAPLDTIDTFLDGQSAAVDQEEDIAWNASKGLLDRLDTRLSELRAVVDRRCHAGRPDELGPKPVDCRITPPTNEKAGG